MIHVAVISPIQAVRSGLGAMLADDDRFTVSEAASLSEVENLAGEIDVVVAAGGALSQDVLNRLVDRQETAPAVLLMSELPERAHLAATGAPAWGVLNLDCSIEELRLAVFALYHGLLVGAPAHMTRVFQEIYGIGGAQPEAMVDALTKREIEVLQLLGLGLANKQIAARLGISEHTVKFHISAIYSKLGATNRTEAARLGVQRGLIAI